LPHVSASKPGGEELASGAQAGPVSEGGEVAIRPVELPDPPGEQAASPAAAAIQ
jgi:hypothetical protein